MKNLSVARGIERYLRYRFSPINSFFRYFQNRAYKKDLHARASLEVWDMIPEEQKVQVFKGTAQAEIDSTYLGDILTYQRLSELIPKEWTVVDLGCSYNAQSYLFQDHMRHIAVDFGGDYNETGEDKEYLRVFRFMAPNCEFYNMTIKEFIDQHLKKLDLDTTFAILNWVPPWVDDNNKLVRENFRNLYIRYPASVRAKCNICGLDTPIKKHNGVYYYTPHTTRSGISDCSDCSEWRIVASKEYDNQRRKQER